MRTRDVSRSLTLAQLRWLDRLSELSDLHGLDRGLRPIGEVLSGVFTQAGWLTQLRGSERLQRLVADKPDEPHLVPGGSRVPFSNRSKVLFNDIPAAVLEVAVDTD